MKRPKGMNKTWPASWIGSRMRCMNEFMMSAAPMSIAYRRQPQTKQNA